MNGLDIVLFEICKLPFSDMPIEKVENETQKNLLYSSLKLLVRTCFEILWQKHRKSKYHFSFC